MVLEGVVNVHGFCEKRAIERPDSFFLAQTFSLSLRPDQLDMTRVVSVNVPTKTSKAHLTFRAPPVVVVVDVHGCCEI